jgi:hypothetical protein
LAWHYKNNGIFTVKSAYKLATRLNKKDHGASSKSPDGSRSLWKNIWKTNVPNKVRIFSWRLASDNLPTRENKRCRTLEIQNTCVACGNAKEDSFHATVECTKARALREKMRELWVLPKEEDFRRTGTDWLLILLDKTNKVMHQPILLLLWRS